MTPTTSTPATGRRRRSPVLLVLLAAALIAALAACGTSDAGSDAEGDGSTTVATEGGSLPEYDARADTDEAIGMAVPEVSGQGFDGETISIEADGKAKVILFVAHWCPHCQKEIPLLKSYLDDNPMPDDVELITVSTGAQPGAENYPPSEWLEEEGWAAPTIEDGEDNAIATTFGLTSFPYFVAVDADGKVVQRASGELTTEQFAAVIERAQGA